MSDRTFMLEVVAPDQASSPRPVASLQVPAAGGRLTVLAGHQRMVCGLGRGQVVAVDPSGRSDAWPVSGGVMRVTPRSVILLVPEATWPTRP